MNVQGRLICVYAPPLVDRHDWWISKMKTRKRKRESTSTKLPTCKKFRQLYEKEKSEQKLIDSQVSFHLKIDRWFVPKFSRLTFSQVLHGDNTENIL